MYHPRFSPRGFVIGLALTTLLAVALTLAVVAQDPDDRDATAPPDKVTVVEEVELLPDPEAPNATVYFRFISANNFVPDDYHMTYHYFISGCIYRTGGGHHTSHTIQLPEGAEIDYLRIYFYDNDPSYDAEARLMAYDGYSGSDMIAKASSSGASDSYRSEGSGFFSHFVDNTHEALSLSLYYSQATTANLQICGVRIRYQYTLSTVDLPLILHGATP